MKYLSKFLSISLILFFISVLNSSCSKKISTNENGNSNSNSEQILSSPSLSSSVESFSPTANLASASPIPTENPKAEELFQKGFALYNQFEYDSAIKYFDMALNEQQDYYKALNGKGIALCFKGSYKEGIGLIDTALSINPDYAYSYYCKALAYKLQKDLDNALTWFNKSIELDSSNAWAYFGIATIYGDRNDAENAVKYLKKAIELEPSAKEVAKTQSHFDGIRNNKQFTELIK